MTEIAYVSLIQELKGFGVRIFDFTSEIEREERYRLVARMRREAALAPVKLARAAAAADERAAERNLRGVFRTLSEVVSCLDLVPKIDPSRSVEAAALAAEATGLCESVYDILVNGSFQREVEAVAASELVG